MRIIHFLIGCSFVFYLGCVEKSSDQLSNTGQSSSKGISNPIIDSNSIDTLARLKVIHDSITLFSNKFDYQQHDFPYKTYYHEKWRGTYKMANNALIAGIDSVGRLFLISVYEGWKPLKHDRIRVICGDSVWVTSKADIPNPFEGIISPHTTQWEVNIYSNETGVIRAISKHINEEIWYEYLGEGDTLRIELLNEYKRGISDCDQLSSLLREKRRLTVN